jgi:hypothetical protein
MSSYLKLGFFLLVASMVSGCTKSTANLVEIVGLNPENPHEFSFQVVPVDPKNSPLDENAQDLVLIKGSEIHLSELAKIAKSSTSFSMLEEELDKSFGGDPVDLLVTESDGVYRATTYEALLSLSAYQHLLSIMKFAKELGLEQGLNLKKSLKLGLYADIYLSDDAVFPLANGDNALYIGSADMMVLLPISDNEGLPVSMHQGVLAHEYHHRLFFKRIWHNHESKKSWNRYQRRFFPGRSKQFNRSERLLTATDEALADLFAIAYTSLPDYLSLSLTTKRGDKIKNQRDLNGEFANSTTYEQLAFPNGNRSLITRCGNSKNFTTANYNFYCLATVIAKALYEASDRNIETMRNFTIKAVHEALEEVATKLANGEDYNVHLFFEPLARYAKQNNEAFYKALCHQLGLRFSFFKKSGRIPSCPR